MAPVPIELDLPRPANGAEGIIIINDLDELTDATIVMGCGDDNPYR